MSANPMSIVAGLLLLAVSLISFAQEPKTVGDLIDRGGTQVTREELIKLLTGAVNGGVQHGTGAKFRNTLKEDGSFKGTALLTNGQTVDVFGTWTVGQNADLFSELSNSKGSRWKSSVFYFKFENKYFGALSTDGNAQLLERVIERQ